MLWRLSATLLIRRAASAFETLQARPALIAAETSRRPAADCVRTFSIRSTNGRKSALLCSELES